MNHHVKSTMKTTISIVARIVIGGNIYLPVKKTQYHSDTCNWINRIRISSRLRFLYIKWTNISYLIVWLTTVNKTIFIFIGFAHCFNCTCNNSNIAVIQQWITFSCKVWNEAALANHRCECRLQVPMRIICTLCISAELNNVIHVSMYSYLWGP